MKELASENKALQERAIGAESDNELLKQEVEGMREDLMKFVNNDGETKKLLDMFEKALETLAAENKLLKTKLADSLKETEESKIAKEKAEQAYVKVVEESTVLVNNQNHQKVPTVTSQTVAPTAIQSHTNIAVQEANNQDFRQTRNSSNTIGKGTQHAANMRSVKPSETEIQQPTNIEKRLKQALYYASQFEGDENEEDDPYDAGHIDYQSVKLQPSEQRYSQPLSKLKEDNIVLARENESLRARANALEREATATLKSAKTDAAVIGRNIAAEILTTLRSVNAYGSSDDDGPSIDPLLIRSSIKPLKPKKKTKVSVASSLTSTKQRPTKKEARSRYRNDDTEIARNTNQEERQAQLENFLCTQIERLNSDLNKEREWRDAILQAGQTQLVQGTQAQTRLTASSLRSPPTSVRNVITALGPSAASFSPQYLSQLEALARAADPDIMQLRSQQEQAELGRVETSMHRAFDDFERKQKNFKNR